MYLNSVDIASLYAQLRGEDVIETVTSMEYSSARGIKMALAAFIKGSGDSSTKESRSVKTSARPENMLREIVASLRADGTLNTSIDQAIARTKRTNEPAWFEARHKFSIPVKIEEFNRARTVVFLSGFPPHRQSSEPRIEMHASLAHFPSVSGGQLGVSGHDAFFIRKQNGVPYPFLVFGALSAFTSDAGFQIKPIAIRL